MSTPVRRAIYGKLAGDSTLNNLLGAAADGYSKAIYHDEAPENAPYPYVILSKSSGYPAPLLAFADSPDKARIDIWMIKAVDRNTTADAVEAIDGRIETLLTAQAATLSVSGGTAVFLHRQSDVEYPEVTNGVSYKHCGGLYRLETRFT